VCPAAVGEDICITFYFYIGCRPRSDLRSLLRAVFALQTVRVFDIDQRRALRDAVLVAPGEAEHAAHCQHHHGIQRQERPLAVMERSR